MTQRRRCGATRFGLGCMAGMALSVMLLQPGTTLGDPLARDPAGAEDLFRQGVAAKNRGDWQTACEKFGKSFDLDPAVSTQYKIAACYEHDGKLASAWYGYQSALKMNRETRSDQRRRELEASIRAALGGLEARVPKLRITVTPVAAGLEITRDGDAIVPASVLGEALPIDPGEHVIVARAPGYHQEQAHVAVNEGHTVDATITLHAAVSAQPSVADRTEVPRADTSAQQPPAAPSVLFTQTGPHAPQRPQNDSAAMNGAGTANPFTPRASDQAHSSWTQQHTAYLLGATSLATLLAAGYFGLRTLHYVEQMEDFKRADGNSYSRGVLGPREEAVKAQNIALLLAGVSAALGAVSVGLYVAAPRSAKSERSATHPSTENHETLAGISATGRW